MEFEYLTDKTKLEQTRKTGPKSGKKEDPSKIKSEYKAICKERRMSEKNKKLQQLKAAHEMAHSGLFENFKVFMFYDRDTAYEMGCEEDEYDPEDWKSEVPMSDDLDQFIKNCCVDHCAFYQFMATSHGETFLVNVKSN